MNSILRKETNHLETIGIEDGLEKSEFQKLRGKIKEWQKGCDFVFHLDGKMRNGDFWLYDGQWGYIFIVKNYYNSYSEWEEGQNKKDYR